MTTVEDKDLALAGMTRPDGTHRYLSVPCLHGEHTHCAMFTCKYCEAACVCLCHATNVCRGEPKD